MIANLDSQPMPPLPEVWMVDWIASKTGEHYREFHDSESGAFLTAAQLAAATPAMPARITQIHPDPARSALVEALKTARDYVTSELSRERETFKGHENCSDIPAIERDLAQIDAAFLAAGEQGERYVAAD